MRRTIILLPNLLGATPDDSPLLQRLDTLRTMAELGVMKRLTTLPPMETPEAVWLGMKPEEGQMRQGPLTVSALAHDPPDRSTHFHVSLLGVLDGIAVEPPIIIPEEDLRLILEQAKRLNSKSLTFLEGENLDHALVWEDLGDLHTLPAKDLIGQAIKPNLPEGDAEKELRRFIDDSVNLLNELELNKRRVDQGIAPLNLLWPWGDGRRKAVPNLLLKRGSRAHVESNSMRMAGLTRLVGYRHGDRHKFGKGTSTKLDKLAEIALAKDASIIVIDAPQDLRAANLLEELHWFTKELDTRLLKPVFDSVLKQKSRLAIIATGQAGGLALQFETGMATQNVYPFDERALEEKGLPKMDVWTYIERTLEPLPH
jgi:2,3-bisphosphoglycerate-independent phosphoglycerate mutase